MDEGHGVHRGAAQRVPQHVGLHGAPERHVEPDALLAASADQLGEALAERPVDERQRALAHAVAHRQLHEPRRRGRADEHGARRAEQAGERRRQPLEQPLHRARAVTDHRPLHRGQDFGVDVGGARQKKPPEHGRRGWCGHAVARASASTSPSSTTSFVFTRRTPSSPHSRSRCSDASRSMPRIASVTTNSRVCGRRCSKPSTAALSHTSVATPYSTMSSGSSTSSAGVTFSLLNTSKRCLWKRMSPLWPRRRSASGFESLGAGSITRDRKSTRLNSSHTVISYAVFCLKKKKKKKKKD